jgi:SAM-dependent methyltransferase
VKDELATEYNSNFFDALSPGSRGSAAIVIPLVEKLVGPSSVLDVGCGVGTWLAEWQSRGVTDVFGLDGEYVAESALQIPADKFQSKDLRQPFSMGRRFDLVECLEVAEHLDEPYADGFIESLAGHADTILFSAAIPGQTGNHHVNEQWPSYWIPKFAKLGFQAFDVIRPRIWADRHVEVWYRQNILIFSKTLTFEGAENIPDLVHPDLWDFGRNSVRWNLGNLRSSIRYNLRKGRPSDERRANTRANS